MKEYWKNIPGWENEYMVSSKGQVKSLEREVIDCNGKMWTLPERIRKQYKQPNGYMEVTLSKNNHQHRYSVHSLVMKAFVGERPEGMDIDHKDSNRANNELVNLRYVTRKDNVNNPNSSIIKTVLQYSLEGEYIRSWVSVADVERVLGYDSSSIAKCCKNKLKTANGYQWQYLNSDGSYPTVNAVTITGGRKKPISQYTLQDELIRNWKSTMEINKQLGYDNSAITKCCKRKQITAYGYIWKYA